MVLVLADAALELVPKEIWSHPAVRKTASRRGKKPGEMLLDVSLHYHAMRGLADRDKRGRPDIVHLCMLVALSSALNKVGLLRLVVHTFSDVVIRVRSDVRIPRNYNRFVGLMEQLMLEGRVPPGSEDPLMVAERMDFRRLVEVESPSAVVVLDEEGVPLHPRRLGEVIVGYRRPVVVVGAFQRGRFREEVVGSADLRACIAGAPLDAWAVVARVISTVEDALDVYPLVGGVEGPGPGQG